MLLEYMVYIANQLISQVRAFLGLIFLFQRSKCTSVFSSSSPKLCSAVDGFIAILGELTRSKASQLRDKSYVYTFGYPFELGMNFYEYL